MDNTPSAKTQIRNLLLVLFSGIFCAFLFTFFLIHIYGPSGRYLTKNVLLAPETIPQLAYNAYDPKTNGDARFTFDKIELSYYDQQLKTWQKKPIDLSIYSQFYQLVVDDESVKEVTADIERLFNRDYPTHLILSVKTNSPAPWQATTKIFQEIQLVFNGDHYRIELHEQPSALSSEWAYFYHPGIYQQAMQLLTPSTFSPHPEP